MTETTITDKHGTRTVLEHDPLRVAIRAELGTQPGPRLSFPWRIIWVALGRAGVVLIRNEKRGRLTHQIVEPRTLNQTVRIERPDGQVVEVELAKQPRLKLWAVAYLAWRLSVWLWWLSTWRPFWKRVSDSTAARWRAVRAPRPAGP